MKDYVWLFPVIFMFHEMEEIIGFKFFLERNKDKLNNLSPFIFHHYKDYSTEGFALAVYEELILCILISTLAFFLNKNILWYLWLGAFIGCDIHFFIHLIQVSSFRHYIPASITSLICLPINTVIICKCLASIEDSIFLAGLCITIGAILVFVNLFFAQKICAWFTRKKQK